jgi:hypothetical protein
MAVERKSRSRGDKYASYVVSDDATADIFSSIQMHFGLVSKRCILRHIQCFGVGHWIRHNDYTLLWCSSEAIGKEDDEKI